MRRTRASTLSSSASVALTGGRSTWTSATSPPDGGWWVERGVGPSDRRFDVFSAEGVYLGTLPAGTPKPVAFPAPALYVGLERDAVGRVVLTAYRIERG